MGFGDFLNRKMIDSLGFESALTKLGLRYDTKIDDDSGRYYEIFGIVEVIEHEQIRKVFVTIYDAKKHSQVILTRFRPQFPEENTLSWKLIAFLCEWVKEYSLSVQNPFIVVIRQKT